MQVFYQEILNKLLCASAWPEPQLTALEIIVYRECCTEEDRRRIRAHRMQLMLRDIDNRAAALRLSRRFCCLLRRRPQLEAVLTLKQQGLSTEEAAEALHISCQTIINAEEQLLRLYRRTYRTPFMDTAPADIKIPHVQTLNALSGGTFRVFRHEATGVTRYRFYHQDRLLGTGAVTMGRDFPVVLQCNGLLLNSRLNPDQTIVPGCSRTIVDADNATAAVARLTYLKSGQHKLQLNWDTQPMTLQIDSEGDTHLCFMNHQLIAKILPLEEVQRMGDWELRYCMKPEGNLSDETAVLLMSFPMLRFGW